MPDKRDKTTGLPLPNPVDPDIWTCYSMQIPNAPEYRQALRGVLSELGKAYNWAQTVGQSNAPSEEAAQLWRQALNTGFYNDDCEAVPMSCGDVADCIETSEAVKNAIGGIVSAVPIEGMVFPPGLPLTPSQMSQNLNEVDECAFDPYWAQVEQYVDYLVDLGQDVLDQIAVYSAALDVGEAVPMGKFLSKYMSATSAGKLKEFLQWVVTFMKAQYEAADNEANRNAIKCAIFCENRDTCVVSIQGTLNTLNERMGGLLSPTDLDDLPALVQAFITASTDPSLALDLWLLFLMGTAKTAGMFGLQGIDQTIQLVLAVAVNDANNDWETLCEDCPPPTDSGIVMFEPAGLPGGSYVGDENSGVFTAGEGPGGLYRIAFQFGELGGCKRFSSVVYSTTPAYNSAYSCDANPKTNGYTSGLTGGPIIIGDCFGGALWGNFGAFTVTIIFEDDC